MTEPEREMMEKLIEAVNKNTEIKRQGMNKLEATIFGWCFGFFMIFIYFGIIFFCYFDK